MTGGDLTGVMGLARQVSDVGAAIGLPYVATSPDVAGAAAIRGPDGRPLNETVFRWIDPGLRYWEDPGFALRSVFVHAARVCSEPFFYADGQLTSWRRNPALETVVFGREFDSRGIGAAIVAPAYLPGGVIGAVAWAAAERLADIEGIFAANAGRLHVLALRLIATHAEAAGHRAPQAPRLTRREIQCLKWAAAGKTDQEIGQIVRIAAPTVRFHLSNAAEKLQVSGRLHAVRRAAALGYIGRDQA
jgi:DNA-binding CsgD family transcriptional regulator